MLLSIFNLLSTCIYLLHTDVGTYSAVLKALYSVTRYAFYAIPESLLNIPNKNIDF